MSATDNIPTEKLLRLMGPRATTQAALLAGRRPVTIMGYGPPKKGKTTDLVRTWQRFIAFGDPTPILQAADVWTGISPFVPKTEILNLRDATAYLRMVANRREAGKPVQFDAAGFDDFSLACDEEYRLICEEISGRNGFARVNALRDAIIEYRRAARLAGLHLHHNAHVAEPDRKEGKIMGGPRMPIKTTRDWIPVIATTVLYITADPKRQGDFRVSAYCDPSDQDFLHGDRLHVAPFRGPVNTGEFLRAAGYTIPRHPRLEALGAESLVEKIAVALLSGKPREETYQKVFTHLMDKCGLDDIRLFEWLFQDAQDRAEIRESVLRRRLSRFFEPLPVPEVDPLDVEETPTKAADPTPEPATVSTSSKVFEDDL